MSIRGEEAIAQGKGGRFAASHYANLPIEAGDMSFDRPLAQPQYRGEFLVAQALREQPQYLGLPPRQPCGRGEGGRASLQPGQSTGVCGVIINRAGEG